MISLGEELKREREFREISLREISDATKINMRMLEAIEENKYEKLPGGIFNRNFIRAYAEFIGLDPEIAVRKYQVQAEQQADQKLPSSLITPVAPEGAFAARKKWIYLLLLTLLAAILAWNFWLKDSTTLWIDKFLEEHTGQQTNTAGAGLRTARFDSYEFYVYSC